MFQNFLLNIQKNRIKVKLQISIFFLIFFVGLREFGGSDYYIYKSYFFNPTKGFFEIGYFYYTKFLNILFEDYQKYLFVTALITNIMLYKYLRRFSYSISILGIYIGRRYIWHDFVLMRQNFAIIIFALSLRYVNTREFKKYFICILIATLFHSSAFLLLPIYLFNRIKEIKFNRRKMVTLILFSLSSFVLMSSLDKIAIFLGRYFRVSALINLNKFYLKNAVNLNYFVLLELGLILLFINKVKFKTHKKFKSFTLYFNLQLLNYLILILFSKFEIIRRVTEYFELPLAVLLSYSLYSSFEEKNKIKNLIMTILIFIYSLIRLFYLLQKFDGGDFLRGTWKLFN